MNISKKNIYFFLASLFLCGSFFIYGKVAFSNSPDHIVISQIQIEGSDAHDEFIELFNPTEKEMDLEGWDIKRKTESGNQSNISTNLQGKIFPGGYFLVLPRANCGENKNETCYKGEIKADFEYTTNSFLSKNNTVLLYNNGGALVDKLGWGKASDFESEAIGANPEKGQSLQRKEENGLVLDTDNNLNDFFVQEVPNPHNASGQMEFLAGKQSFPESKTDKNGTGPEEDDKEETEMEAEAEAELSKKTEIEITEFLPNPEDSDKDNEFIELYNGGSEKIALGEWVLEDKTGKTKIFIIPSDTTLNPGEYRAFFSDLTGITLNNSGDGVVLKDKGKNIVFETPISDSAFEDQSFALSEEGSWEWTLSPTPDRKNVIKKREENSGKKDFEEDKNISGEKQGSDNNVEGFDFSDGIIISEVYPDPSGRDNEYNYEWIELYNISSKDVNLRGWKIDDVLNKGSKPFVVEEERIIKANGYLVFSNQETKIILNNSEDEVNVSWPDGKIVDSLKYAKAIEGWSYSLFSDGKWDWSFSLTPGKENFYQNLKEEAEKEELDKENITGKNNKEYLEISVEDAKKLPKYTMVKISGIVSTPPGIFSKQSFYIAGSGIQVFSYEEEAPEINIGDKIEIKGKISEIGGEKRILFENREDISVIDEDNLVSPKIVLTGDVGEKTEGYLVTVEGKVAEGKGNIFFLDDGSGKVKIYIKKETKIADPEIAEGDFVVVTGQVSRTSLGYRILPRFKNDLKLSKVSGVSTAQASSLEKGLYVKNESIKEKSHFSLFFAIMLLIVLCDWARMRIKSASLKDK